jgi:hypothetical protein
MSVLVEAISVLVTSSTLAAKYPGGVEQYELDAPNDTYCSDGHLTRVGFMAPLDVKAFVNKLRELGLAFHDGRQFVDIAVVDQHQGPTSLCPWLECGRHPKWFALAWLRGMSPSPMAAPRDWTVDQSAQLHFVSQEDAHSSILPLLRDGMVDSVLDYATGKIVYVGRTTDEVLILRKNER